MAGLTRPDLPETIGLFELVLEVADLDASERFYSGAIGLPVVERWGDERPAVWLALGNQGFLGLWPASSGGPGIGIFDGQGGAHVHFAIRVPRGTLATFQERMAAYDYPISELTRFGEGNLALYLKDPDGNVVELTERVTLWDGRPATEETAFNKRL